MASSTASLLHSLNSESQVTRLSSAAGEMVHAADRQHLRAVFGGGHMADLFAVHAHRRQFRSEVAVGVDFKFHAAVAEYASVTTVTMSTPSTWTTMNGAGL